MIFLCVLSLIVDYLFDLFEFVISWIYMYGEESIDYEFWWIDNKLNLFVLFYCYDLIICVNLNFWLIEKKIDK